MRYAVTYKANEEGVKAPFEIIDSETGFHSGSLEYIAHILNEQNKEIENLKKLIGMV